MWLDFNWITEFTCSARAFRCVELCVIGLLLFYFHCLLSLSFLLRSFLCVHVPMKNAKSFIPITPYGVNMCDCWTNVPSTTEANNNQRWTAPNDDDVQVSGSHKLVSILVIVMLFNWRWFKSNAQQHNLMESVQSVDCVDKIERRKERNKKRHQVNNLVQVVSSFFLRWGFFCRCCCCCLSPLGVFISH